MALGKWFRTEAQMIDKPGWKVWCDKHGFTYGEAGPDFPTVRTFQGNDGPALELWPSGNAGQLIFLRFGIGHMSESEAILWLLANGFSK